MASTEKEAAGKGHRRVYSNSELTDETAVEQNVVIVGGGMAGLTCARILLEEDPHCHVTLLEAHSSVGGRIQVENDFVPGQALDLGAEYIHGTGTLLTHYIDEFRAAGLLQPTPRAKAIQQQLAEREEKKQKKLLHRRRPSYNPDDSDSSSDDGIMVFNKGGTEGEQQTPANKPFLMRHNSASDLMDAADGGRSGDSSLNSEKSFFDESRHTQHTQSSADTPAAPTETKTQTGNFFEEIFITAHADGGPNEHPTNEGKYGMYYVKGKLRMYDDPLTRPLDVAIESMLEQPPVSNNLSVHDALVRQLEKQQLMSTSKIPMPELYDLAVAGYGNTATITDLTQLSLPMLRVFENHWATAEEHGDLRLPAHLGMYSVVQAMQMYLEKTFPDRFRLLLNAPVQEVDQLDKHSATVRYMTVVPPTASSPSSSASRLEEEFEVKAHRVVVAVPPPILPRILPRLSKAKRQALEYVSFSDIIKVVLKFNNVFWPEKLQSIISGEGLFPELWFRPQFGGDDGTNLVVFYLTDDYAQAFTEECQFENFADDSGVDWDKGKAADLCIQHLSRVLSVDPEALKLSLSNTLIHDWKSQKYVAGGHMAPIIGMTMDHLRAMATPEGRIHFCGEATNTNACGTIQAAMETGVRAAKEVVYFGNKEREQKLKILKQRQLHQEQLRKEREEEAKKDALIAKQVKKPEGSQFKQNGEREKQKVSAPEGHPQKETDDSRNIAERISEPLETRVESTSESEKAISAPPRQTNAEPSPLETSKLIQRQMDLSRILAKQEESSFHLINAMEQRQMEASRALLEQEEVSFHMIQTVEHLAAKCLAYEKQLGQAGSSVEHETELRDAKAEKEAILLEHQAQMEKFETLQKRFKTLRQETQEKDSVIKDQERVIDLVSQKAVNLKKAAESESQKLRHELETKNKLINDRDAIIKIMAQKMSDMKGRAENAEIEAKAARDMVKDRDAVIRIVSQRMESMKKQAKAQLEAARRQNSSLSPSRRMKQVKAEREERLQEIMSRIRTTNKEKDDSTTGRANRTPTKQLSKNNHVSPSSSSTAGTVMTEESNASGGKSEAYASHKALY